MVSEDQFQMIHFSQLLEVNMKCNIHDNIYLFATIFGLVLKPTQPFTLNREGKKEVCGSDYSSISIPKGRKV